ncbi:metal-independent alpha-mannosidase [Colwellia psychrerythraea]|uniref:Metal-independent alpha-mannosidase n=1 Tax=Colwellia psychrerythraea TaxID=28229 RepID=A0A1Y5EJB8_COLPS|nr:metal-independent alpha-mannosidase [Colwellia psychrerythraea]
MKKRSFIKSCAALGILSALAPMYCFSNGKTKYVSKRPPINERTFVSQTIEELILKTKNSIDEAELAWLFENCFPNTLDTTVDYEVINDKPDTFIITGDIDAMWLRDSTAQVWPYMPYIKKDITLKNLILGLINRQTNCILVDPYANAFYKDLGRVSHWVSDKPSPINGVHERKWEIDSLCYPIRLAHEYFNLTQDTTPFDAQWDKAMRLLVDTLRTEQRLDGSSPYTFGRETTKHIDAATFNGTGRPIKPTGLICSMFRPSDDATLYPFLIPSNVFAAISLNQLAELYRGNNLDLDFAEECSKFSEEITNAVHEHAVFEHLHFGKIYAYEIDGFGNKNFMDDANVPSLMSLAYLAPKLKSDPIYQNTRKFLLSEHNPYFLKGKAAEGQASPHTGKSGIWPMGIILRAMTSDNNSEISKCLDMLQSTHAGTGFMHESFDKNDASNYTREWFAWANTLFGELILKVTNESPGLLSKNNS